MIWNWKKLEDGGWYNGFRSRLVSLTPALQHPWSTEEPKNMERLLPFGDTPYTMCACVGGKHGWVRVRDMRVSWWLWWMMDDNYSMTKKNAYICTDSWHLYRLVKTSICTGILLTTVYGLDFRHRRSHVHMIISDGQQSFIPRTKPWKPQDHDDLRCQVVAFLSQLPRGPKVT